MNKPGTQLLSIGEAAAALGVAVATLRRWHRQGRLLPALRTLGGHRRYASEAVRTASGAQTPEILTVFSSRLYGSRSRKNLKALAN